MSNSKDDTSKKTPGMKSNADFNENELTDFKVRITLFL